MSQSAALPLVLPPRTRGWLDILMLRPLSRNPHAALVLTRNGRVAEVLPANSSWVFSDYLNWPCEIYEVDMRERRMLIDLRLESCDPGRFFVAEIQMLYRATVPERLAIEVGDAPSEIEISIGATVRKVARPLGLEQCALLKDSIEELLRPGGSLRDRVRELGVELHSFDVAVEPDPADRAFAEQLRDLQRERPVLWRFTTESYDPSVFFEVQFAGAYRVRARAASAAQLEEIEFSLREAIARIIARHGAQFTLEQFDEAERLLLETLRGSPAFQAELAAAEVELLRPSVEIFPARPMLVDMIRARLLPAPEQSAADPLERMLPAPALPTEPPVEPALSIARVEGEGDPAEIEHELDTGGWVASGFYSSAIEDEPNTPIEEMDALGSADWPPDGQTLAAALPDWLHDERAAQVDTALDVSPSAGPDTADAQLETQTAGLVLPSIEPSDELFTESRALVPFNDAPGTPPLPRPIDLATQVDRWIRLLRSEGDQEFEGWAQVLLDQPDRLPILLSGLIRDPAVLMGASDPAFQSALTDTLARMVLPSDPPAWLMNESAGGTDGEPLPDWLRTH